MPSFKYFRLVITDEKPIFKISALHLYNDDLRVDEDATLSSGFTVDTVELNKLKNNTPSIDSFLNINSTLLHRNKLWIKWTFSADTNVNAFKIGFGDNELNSLQRFKLQYSADDKEYKDFIFIGPDKKLGFTSAYSFSELKPNGEMFPWLFSKINHGTSESKNDLFSNTLLKIGNDRRSILLSNNPVLDNYGSNIPNSSFDSCNPGFSFLVSKKGKFYFEIKQNFFNTFSDTNGSTSTPWNTLYLAILPTSNELLMNSPVNINTRYSALGLTTRKIFAYQDSATAGPYGSSFSRFSDTVLLKTFVPGIQHGIMLDFENKQSRFVNPTWSDVSPNKYPFKSDILNGLPGDKFILSILSPRTKIYPLTDGNVYFNFGQLPFINEVPEGYNSGLGPRWREEPVDDIPENKVLLDLFSEETITTNIENPYFKEDFLETKNKLKANNFRTGAFYIKGTVTRDPDDPLKKFSVFLLNNADNSVIDNCLVDKDGLYEFYGINDGLYTILSIDIKVNIVSETIGPIKPMEII